MRVGLLYSRIRRDEKLLLAELRDRGHDVHKIDVRDEQFPVHDPPAAVTDLDLAIDRCLATSRSRYVTRFLASYGVPVVNGPETAAVCADKVRTSLTLREAGVPTPRTRVAFDTDSAMAAVEAFGYPCVVKPVVGSWGRLLAKLDTPAAAEAVFEHKATLGHYEHKVFYVQEFVDKPGRDLRVLAVDGEPIAGMVRSGEHWVTNAATGAEVTAFEIDDRVRDLVETASAAVGGGLLGVDLMETGADGYTVHEINHTVEFKALDGAVDVDVPARVVDWLETKAGTETTTGSERTDDALGGDVS